MTDKTQLRALIEKAAADLDLYRYPDVNEASAALLDLAKAAGEMHEAADIRRLSLVELFIGADGNIQATWSYHESDGNCDRAVIPARFLDEPHPLNAAKRWYLSRLIAEMPALIEQARKLVTRREQQLSDLQARLAALGD